MPVRLWYFCHHSKVWLIIGWQRWPLERDRHKSFIACTVLKALTSTDEVYQKLFKMFFPHVIRTRTDRMCCVAHLCFVSRSRHCTVSDVHMRKQKHALQGDIIAHMFSRT